MINLAFFSFFSERNILLNTEISFISNRHLNSYQDFFLWLLACLFLTVLLILVVLRCAPSSKVKTKLTTYECGFEPFSISKNPNEVQFFLLGLLFLVFDLELLLTYPWIVYFKNSIINGSFPLVIYFFLLLFWTLILEFKFFSLDIKRQTQSINV